MSSGGLDPHGGSSHMELGAEEEGRPNGRSGRSSHMQSMDSGGVSSVGARVTWDSASGFIKHITAQALQDKKVIAVVALVWVAAMAAVVAVVGSIEQSRVQLEIQEAEFRAVEVGQEFDRTIDAILGPAKSLSAHLPFDVALREAPNHVIGPPFSAPRKLLRPVARNITERFYEVGDRIMSLNDRGAYLHFLLQPLGYVVETFPPCCNTLVDVESEGVSRGTGVTLDGSERRLCARWCPLAFDMFAGSFDTGVASTFNVSSEIVRAIKAITWNVEPPRQFRFDTTRQAPFKVAHYRPVTNASMSMIGRLPVFLDESYGLGFKTTDIPGLGIQVIPGKLFWGFISMIFDFDVCLNRTGVTDWDGDSPYLYDITWAKPGPEGATQETVFFSLELNGTTRDPLVVHDFAIVEMQWRVALYLKDPNHHQTVVILTYIFSILAVTIGAALLLVALVTRAQNRRLLEKVLPDKHFVEHANAPIFGVDKDMKVFEWNHKMESITGFMKAEVLDTHMVENYVIETHRVGVASVLGSVFKGRETASYELPLRVNRIDMVHMLFSATARRDDTGTRIVGVVCVGQDITAEKTAKLRSDTLAEELRSLIQTANAPIFGTDAHGMVNEWNDKCREFSGLGAGEALGVQWSECIKPIGAHKAMVEEAFEQALCGKETVGLEFTVRSAGDGSPGCEKMIDLLLNVSPRKNTQGEIVGCIALAQDVSSYRQLISQEAEIAKVHASNNAKTQFLATMSHEMRTPLNVIGGMISMMLDTGLGDEQFAFASQIEKSCAEIQALVDSILDLSKIEGGAMDLDTEEFDVRALIEAEMLSKAADDSKGLEACLYMDLKERYYVRGDRAKFRQIVANLVANAFKFTMKGLVRVEVRVEDETDRHRTFRVSVQDTGIGIPPAQVTKIFERFSQVDERTTRAYGGTGLGLAISKEFTEIMGGMLTVESVPGVGSTFSFRLPLAIVPPEHADAGLPLETLAIGNATVLAVFCEGDTGAGDEALRNTSSMLLEEMGVMALELRSMKACVQVKDAELVIVFLPPISKEGIREGADKMHSNVGQLLNLMHQRPSLKAILVCPAAQQAETSAYHSLFPRVRTVLRPFSASKIRDAVAEQLHAPAAQQEERVMRFPMIGDTVCVLCRNARVRSLLHVQVLGCDYSCFSAAMLEDALGMLADQQSITFVVAGPERADGAWEVCGEIRQWQGRRRVYVVCVVDTFDAETVERCLTAHADRVVKRDCDDADLITSVGSKTTVDDGSLDSGPARSPVRALRPPKMEAVSSAASPLSPANSRTHSVVSGGHSPAAAPATSPRRSPFASIASAFKSPRLGSFKWGSKDGGAELAMVYVSDQLTNTLVKNMLKKLGAKVVKCSTKDQALLHVHNCTIGVVQAENKASEGAKFVQSVRSAGLELPIACALPSSEWPKSDCLESGFTTVLSRIVGLEELRSLLTLA
eukprot:CAMPEP_0169428762 /NCGR_PEP_ID=MMETSP1042-20121227/1500_1 /TAXON_ID=464988 /ORGANISM="Hemiselmis andersenii, Strain CCMP1180" /LENGTH=1446 /DNA_ID=CAMNT_0009538955 /DNA_START=134 /DNA_END=4470 /DNA_ORIENTATION=-